MNNQRMWDLVRYMRNELHFQNLITDAEYALLAQDHAAVKRLEDYDAIRKAAHRALACDSCGKEVEHPLAYCDACKVGYASAPDTR